jgi:hypothetical protein
MYAKLLKHFDLDFFLLKFKERVYCYCGQMIQHLDRQHYIFYSSTQHVQEHAIWTYAIVLPYTKVAPKTTDRNNN